MSREGRPLTDENKLEKYVEKLKQTNWLPPRRRGTFCTFWGHQFLILLIGLHLEDSSVIQNRMQPFLSFWTEGRAAIEV